MRKLDYVVILAALPAIAIVIVGYVLLGLVGAGLFTLGYLAGFAIWLAIPDRVTFADIWLPYAATLVLFVLHKVEERELNFFRLCRSLPASPSRRQVPRLLYFSTRWRPLGFWCRC